MSVEYFVIVMGFHGQPLDECGPFFRLEEAMSYVVEKGYFQPPKKLNNNAYIAVDASGVASLYLAKATVGPHHLQPDVESIKIRRRDVYLTFIAESAMEELHH